MRSLAVAFPSTVRDNAYFEQLDPARTLARRTQPRLWATPDAPASATRSRLFDEEMAKYASDPFRGTVMRRTLGGGKSLPIEERAARSALAAAQLGVGDVDLLFVASFIADQPGVGNAAFLARALGFRGPALNFETACSSATVGFQHACALVQAGQHRRVLVVVSCDYTTHLEDTDTMSWFMGDGAGAFVVEAVDEGYGLLGGKTISTAETCGAFFYEDVAVGDTVEQRMRADPGVNQVLRDTAADFVRDAVTGAVAHAGVSLASIDYFIFNTPNAWYASFCARALEVDHRKTISAYPLYANVGPVLMPANLHLAASLGRIARDDLVLLYSVGSVSTASAAVMRWSDVALGAEPEPGLYARWERELSGS
jgi:3-oxoacyl-[acyl-carrier-protein] synthase-3